MNKMKSNFLMVFLGILAGVFLLPVADSSAVMPPDHYERQAEHSTIKAVAVVKAVRVLSKTEQSTHKEVTFSMVQSFGTESLDVFSGTCYSVDAAGQDPGAGGTLYYYPTPGTTVLVTIFSDRGSITSLTVLDEALEAELEKNGIKNIRFVMGKAKIDEPDAPEE
jgi:hypothetical protein